MLGQNFSCQGPRAFVVLRTSCSLTNVRRLSVEAPLSGSFIQEYIYIRAQSLHLNSSSHLVAGFCGLQTHCSVRMHLDHPEAPITHLHSKAHTSTAGFFDNNGTVKSCASTSSCGVLLAVHVTLLLASEYPVDDMNASSGGSSRSGGCQPSSPY